MQTISRTSFTTVTTEGAILPADLLQRIVDGRNLDGLKPTDYHLAPNERLNEAINRSWNRLLGVWENFNERRQALPEYDRGTTLTRESWLLILLDELGFGRPDYVRSLTITDDGSRLTDDEARDDATRYPISHQWQQVPLHLISFRQSLDRVDEDRGGRYRRSPHSLVQEFLNRSEQHLWGMVSNGLRLRLLRDNVSFTRAAYLEFDLEAMMDGELYADFTLLWLVAHQSRFEGKPESCWLEQWSQAAAEQGTRALDSLRDGVQNAISELGRGFLAHPANGELRAKLQNGDGPGKSLDKQEYYRQLLRLVYRLIFLFVAEERHLLLMVGTDAATRERYYQHYSVTHLRELAERRRGSPHPDLYRGLRLVMELLREGYEPLGLPGLGSFLFSERSTPDLDGAEIANEALLKAIRALTLTIQDGVRRPVDYKNLGSEELGSVYESLLELHPELNVGAATFNLRTAAGSERKTTGSYYTPTSLINSLLDTALEPVIRDRTQMALMTLRDADKNQEKSGQTSQTPQDHQPNQRHQRTILEQAILSIKVVDPAAGSGHFLIAAAHRLARHLARIRTGDGEPSPEANRAALRDVVRHCIHGVDINEMAVELCKVALWMETLDPGKPLSFLERNIQVGNSLIGATPELLEEGIPDDAFQPITGDDKAYVREFKSVNREQRKGKGSLFKGQTMQPWDRLGNFAAAMRHLDEMDGDTVQDVRAQETAYEELVRSQHYVHGKLWADAWCAAFVWPKKPEEQGGYSYPITEEEFRLIERNPFGVPAWMREEITALAGEYRFFHWHLAFPHVFEGNADDADGTQIDADKNQKKSSANQRHQRNQRPISSGFDVVLGNPPWERIKLQEKEWFATRSPEIANARNKAARTKLIKKLTKEDPDLYAAFLADKRRAEGESHIARNSGLYPLTGHGDINTYQLFAGLARRLLHPAGRVGIILPSGIATDYTTRHYFQDIMESGALASLYDFENREGIFPGVHRSYKFCLLTLAGSERPVKEAEFLFFAQNPADLNDRERRFTLSGRDLALINPNTRTCPIFRSRRDAELTKGIYRRVPVLIEEGPPERNPWGIEFLRMFDMSNDSHLFRTREELEAEGYELQGNRFVTTERRSGDSRELFLPLYEGKSVELYDHRHASIASNPDNPNRKAYPIISTIREHLDPRFSTLPQYWINKRNVAANSPNDYPYLWFMVYKRTTTASSERTLKCCVTPYTAIGDKLPIILLGSASSVEYGLFLGNLNSLILDFVARQKTGYVNLAQFVFEQFPVLSSDKYGVLHKELIVSRILELTYTAYDLRSFAQDLGYHGPPFRWDEERRFLLRCELDAAYFHLYGIERDDVDYIMDTFPIVRRKDEKAHGEYRTKRVILEMYDEMARAMETGQPYQTRLEPPPAHSDAAHEWDEAYLGPELPVEEWWKDGTENRTQMTQIAQMGADEKRVAEVGPVYEADGDGSQKKRRSADIGQAQQGHQRHQRPSSPSTPLFGQVQPPSGTRNERLKRVMELGRKKGLFTIQELVASLDDVDESIRWLAGSSLVRFASAEVVEVLRAYLAGEPTANGRAEAQRVLKLIGETAEDEEVRGMAREVMITEDQD